jgi:hypothetical protein
MERTYSQKVARTFEVADYILLLPASFGALLATLAFSAFTLLVYAFFIVGVVLLVGYFKHSRGRLGAEYVSALWIGTAIYNLILLLPCLFWAAMILQEGIFRNSDGGAGMMAFMIGLAIIGGYLTAVLLAVKAYSFEKRKKYL